MKTDYPRLSTYVKSRFGLFRIEATEFGLFSVSREKNGRPKDQKDWSGPSAVRARQHLQAAQKFLRQYLSGQGGGALKKIPVDLRGYTAFEIRVLQKLRGIRHGKASSYKKLAALARSPRAARAVGSVMKKNRIPIVIPCHRILQESGKLGGYSGGLSLKKKLLELEKKRKNAR